MLDLGFKLSFISVANFLEDLNKVCLVQHITDVLMFGVCFDLYFLC